MNRGARRLTTCLLIVAVLGWTLPAAAAAPAGAPSGPGFGWLPDWLDLGWIFQLAEGGETLEPVPADPTGPTTSESPEPGTHTSNTNNEEPPPGDSIPGGDPFG